MCLVGVVYDRCLVLNIPVRGCLIYYGMNRCQMKLDVEWDNMINLHVWLVFSFSVHDTTVDVCDTYRVSYVFGRNDLTGTVLECKVNEAKSL